MSSIATVPGSIPLRVFRKCALDYVDLSNMGV